MDTFGWLKRLYKLLGDFETIRPIDLEAKGKERPLQNCEMNKLRFSEFYTDLAFPQGKQYNLNESLARRALTALSGETGTTTVIAIA